MTSLIRILLAALLTTSALAEGDDIPLVPAQELHARQGLPNFLAKASSPGSTLKVAYFGGSITAQPGWRVKSLALLQRTYPEAKFSEIHAAIGGTGSDLGVFRLQQDVLDKQPDLIFVEFAVNDGRSSAQQIFRCMEGVVRQTWRALPQCDICFVYTITQEFVPPMLDGNFPRAASAMERVADHYGIPSIHMAMEVARLAKEGKVQWRAELPKTDEEKKALGDQLVFAADGVHPYPETGHEFYVQAIDRSLPAIRTASGIAAAHTLGTPLVADNYEHAKIVPISEATLSAGFEKLDPAKNKIAQRFATQVKWLHRAAKAGETITFQFKGTRAFIYDIIGPGSGQVIVTLDDKAPVTALRFDAFCTYERPAMLFLGTDLPDTLHTVKIEIPKEIPDKAAILARRNQKLDPPERYEGNAFYPGSILLVGEVVK